MVVVSLTLATICFMHIKYECHPVLLGKNGVTPQGEYVLKRRYSSSPGYDGDVLQFKETATEVYAIHRTWTLDPSERRQERLHREVAMRFITNGCINVAPPVYEKLVSCCQGSKVVIQ